MKCKPRKPEDHPERWLYFLPETYSTPRWLIQIPARIDGEFMAAKMLIPAISRDLAIQVRDRISEKILGGKIKTRDDLVDLRAEIKDHMRAEGWVVKSRGGSVPAPGYEYKEEK